ncbi:hypothetical protein KAF81_33180, partial [Pseudomonas aeruginosa]|nr:hypothetical protein [Pseudomonas aeruginosa]
MQFLSFRKQSAPSNRLTYAALLVLALGAGAALPDAALADAGKRGGGQGGQAMKNGTSNPLIRGGEGGGLEAIAPGDAVGAGGNASGSPNTGGLGSLLKAGNGESHIVNTNLWGFNGLCTQPCNPDNPDNSGGGGGAAVFGGEDVSFTLSVGKSLTGGQGAPGSAGLVYPNKVMVKAGGGGGGGAGIAVKSGTLTLNGAVTGGAGGSAPGHPGDGGDAVVLGRGNIIVNGRITGGQGGARLYDGKPVTLSGNGGTGISIGSGTVINNDVVLGGAAGAIDSVASKGNVGAALRAGSNTTVTNKRRFNSSGGAAIVFEGNDNTLIMWSGSDILGDVRFMGQRNQLALGSDDDAPTTAKIWSDGNLDFGTDGVYTVRVTPSAADRLDVVNAARLNGAAVKVNAMASDLYAEHTTYTILHADGTFNGTRFGDVASNLAYLTPTLSYSDDDQDALLTLARKEAPAPRPPDPVPPVIDPAPPSPDPVPPVIDPAPPSPDPVPPVIDPAPPSPDPVPPVIDPCL